MQEIKDLNAYRTSLKEKILDAAIKAFCMHGIRAVKMDDIASSLSISKRTLYEIYGDKESLLFSCIKNLHHKKQEFLRDFSQNHNTMEVVLEVYRLKVKELESVNYAFYQDIKLYPEILKYIEQARVNSRDLFLSFMQRGVKEGYFRKGVNYELIGKLFDAIGEYVTKEEVYIHYPHEELLNNLMLVPFRGFCTPKGIKMLDSVDKK